MSVEGNWDNNNGDEDGVLVLVDIDALGDLRTFPERVYDMIQREEQEDHGVFVWEGGGTRFAMCIESSLLPGILENHIGKSDVGDFERRLFKHGWQAEDSTSNPGGDYVAYRNIAFRRGMDRSLLRDIKRIRTRTNRATATATAAAATTTTQPQNPQDASFDGSSGELSLQEGETNDNNESVEAHLVAAPDQLQPQQPQPQPVAMVPPQRSEPQQGDDDGGGMQEEPEVIDIDSDLEEEVQETLIVDNRQDEPRPVTGGNVAANDDTNPQNVSQNGVQEPQHAPEGGDGNAAQEEPEVIELYSDNEIQEPLMAGNREEEEQGARVFDPSSGATDNASLPNGCESEEQGPQRGPDPGEDTELQPQLIDVDGESESEPAAENGQEGRPDGDNDAREADIIEIHDDGADDDDSDDDETVIEVDDDDSDIELILTVPPPAEPESGSAQASANPSHAGASSAESAAEPLASTQESLAASTSDSSSVEAITTTERNVAEAEGRAAISSKQPELPTEPPVAARIQVGPTNVSIKAPPKVQSPKGTEKASHSTPADSSVARMPAAEDEGEVDVGTTNTLSPSGSIADCPMEDSKPAALPRGVPESADADAKETNSKSTGVPVTIACKAEVNSPGKTNRNVFGIKPDDGGGRTFSSANIKQQEEAAIPVASTRSTKALAANEGAGGKVNTDINGRDAAANDENLVDKSIADGSDGQLELTEDANNGKVNTDTTRPDAANDDNLVEKSIADASDAQLELTEDASEKVNTDIARPDAANDVNLVDKSVADAIDAQMELSEGANDAGTDNSNNNESIAEASDGRGESQTDGSGSSAEVSSAEVESAGAEARGNLTRVQSEAHKRAKPVRDLGHVDENDLVQLVKQTWKDARHHCETKHEELLKTTLLEKRNKVMHAATNRKTGALSKLSVFQEEVPANNPCSTLTHHRGKRNVWMTASQSGTEQRLLCVRLEGADAPQPMHKSPIIMSRLQYIKEEKELSHIPYFPDEKQEELEEILTEDYNTEERTKRLARGAIYEEEWRNAELDILLSRLCEEFCFRDDNGKFAKSHLNKVRRRIASIVEKETSMDANWLKERFDELTGGKQPKSDKETNEISAEDVEWRDYLRKVDNYRDLLCTRCYTFNCSFHGTGDHKKPCLALQYEKGVKRVEDGYWESVEFAAKIPKKSCREKDQADRMTLGDTVTPLSAAQEALCQRLYLIFRGDVAKVASVVRAPTEVVKDFVVSKQMKLPQRSLIDKRAGTTVGNKKYTSMNNYNKVWIANIKRTSKHPWCQPCHHSEPCSDSTCSCVQNAFFCTKACSHAEYSPNFFRGCECNGDCSTNSCTCRAANRECDPDLCKNCGACTDPPNTHERVNQKCHNDNMSMRRHRRLLVGKSTISGWGLFTKDALNKGDFIHEYVGELVSDDEGERRGHLYDLAKSNYLFGQSNDYAVDATLKGNKARFGNHSETPNVDTRRMFVNGNVRIGFFANRDIDAQSELFIDYQPTFTAKGTFKRDMKRRNLKYPR